MATSSDWQAVYLQQQAPLLELTRREEECAFYLKKGLKPKELADKLHISTRTVEKHLASLRVKTGTKNINQLLMFMSGLNK